MKRKKKTDCKTIEKIIPDFIDDKLPVSRLIMLLDHVKECPECREELTIQYMVSEGLQRAEKENDYNLLAGLEAKINDGYAKIKGHDVVYAGFAFCIIAIICVIIGVVYSVFF